MQLTNFSKMHGLGNDFIIFNNLDNNIFFTETLVRNLSNRNTGIGCDQLIIVEKSVINKVDFFCRIFNSNGSEVFQCINGVRCFGKFINIKKISTKKNLYVMTKNQKIYLNDIDTDCISVKLSNPIFDPNKIPFLRKYSKYGYYAHIGNIKIQYFIVSLGNPHCVIFVDRIHYANVKTIGTFFEKNSLFPCGVNVNFVEIISRNEIYVRTYERGVGETKACGSGACASVVIGVKNSILNENVLVNLLGGKLNIFCKKNLKRVILSGSAIHVFDGVINLKSFY
ncbi:diaminopimelate epimerase [Buchnera aphidicola (Chaitoregma tattakana)]|uniref:diaminopimelate epimerase n=1 Tax=Buchnera aphidicola TaxID=9 RepID=UPI0031B8946B